jgi:spore coat polysaccharide biosynthesis protein SpsF (cytidylyltransferase family)
MILGIIQARVGSTRLPNKVLMKLGDKTVLENVVERVKASKLISDVFVVTTVNRNDLELVKLCSSKNIRIFCGSENDVLDRFYQVSRLLKPEHIVRITADCPLMDPEIIDLVIEKHLSDKSDYTANIIKETFPDGEDIEVFTFKALEKAWKEAELTSEREHVTPYIRNKDDFKKGNLENNVDLSKKRWTLDNPEDYEFLNKIYDGLYENDNLFGMKKILKFLEQNPELEDINSGIKRNEGYQKSLNEDGVYIS